MALLAYSELVLATTQGIWQQIVNYERTFQCPEAQVFSPSNADEVQEIVELALDSGRKVMTGTRKFNSQIDAACAGLRQIQITTENLNRILHIDPKQRLVTAQAGVRLYQLNAALRHHGLAINMIAEGGFFTIGGMLGSDTHGSTMQQGVSLSEYIVSIKLVDGHGRLRQISGQELQAVRVNLGVLGVVVEATFRVEPLKKVRAKMIHGKDQDIASLLKSLPHDHYSVSLSWFPGIQRYAATIYDFVPNDTPGEAVNKQADFPNWMFNAFKAVYQYANQKNRPFAQCALSRVRHYLRSHSYFKEKDRTVKEPVGWSDDMQYFKCNQNGKCPWEVIPIVIGGYALPLAQIDNWVNDVKAIVKAHSRGLTRPCFPLNGIYFRFGSETDAWLAMNEGRDTVFIDLEYVANTKSSEDDGDMLQITKPPKQLAVIQEIEQLTLQKYMARPHWGKNQPSAFYNVGAKQYPQWQKFIDYKNHVDPNNTFTNPWWERIATEGRHTVEKTPNCALHGNCVCSHDDHCPGDRVCNPGKFWSQARICE
jgi:FAD/FMN-containing dehydrogenase